MSSIAPRGESLRRAVRFVSDGLREDPERPWGSLVQEASLRFDLDPAEAEYLARFYREAALPRSPAEAGGDDEAGKGEAS